MKTNAAISIALAVVAGLFAYQWYRTDKQASDEKAAATTAIERMSNTVGRATSELAESRAVANELRTNLDERTIEVLAWSNRLTQAKADLQTAASTLDRTEARASLEAERARILLEQRDKRITGLEGQNQDLTSRLTSLNQQIAGLETQIAEYRRKVAESEGDRTVLLAHLRELQSQKAELERRFQDIDFLRDEYRRQRNAAAVAKRAESRRKGVVDMDRKGAQLLQEGFRAPAPPQAKAARQDLQVEIDTSGSARVVGRTNATPARNP